MKKFFIVFIPVVCLILISGSFWFYFVKYPQIRLSHLEQMPKQPVSNKTKQFSYLEKLTSEKGKSLNYLVLGDSVAKAYGANNGFFDAVSSYLKSHTKKNISIQNDAVVGSTSEQLLSLIKSGTISKDIRNSNIISINIGGDDILKVTQSDNFLSAIKEFSAVKSDYQSNLQQTLDLIHKINPNTIVLVNDLYNVLSPQNKLFSTSQKLLSNWNLAIYTSVQNYKNVSVVPVDKVLVPQKEAKWLTAEVHPNDLGHKWIAKEIIVELDRKRSL